MEGSAAAAAKSCARERTPDLAGVTARTRTVLYGGGIVHTQTEQTSNHQAATAATNNTAPLKVCEG